MIQENCENCKFFKTGPGLDEDAGRCRKVPPVFVFEPDDMSDKECMTHKIYAWAQPVVAFEDWCGEWKAIA